MSGASNQLVVSLGLNATDFQKKIKVINQDMKKFESEFKTATSAMNKFGDGQQKLSAKLTMLNQKFQMAEKKVELYRKELDKVAASVTKDKKAYDNLSRTLDSQKQKLAALEKEVGKGAKEYKDLEKEIKETEAALKKKANALANSEAKLSRHNTQLNNAQREYNELQREIRETSFALKNFNLEKMGKNFVSVGNAAKSFGSSLHSLGAGLTAGVTVPVVGLGTAAAKTFFDFEHQVRRVNAISSSETMNMGQRFEYLTEQTRKFGRETEWTALDVGQAYEYFAMAGISVEEATKSMGPMLSLASIGMLDLGTAADIVTDTMTPFSKQLDSMGQAAAKNGKEFNGAEWMIDRFAATIVNSNTNVGLMGETLKYAAPVVASYGGKFEDLSLAIGTMANAGIKGSMAGTSLATGLNRIVKPAKEGKAAMEKYGIELKTTKNGQVDLLGTMEHLREKLGKLDEVERGRAVTAIFGQTAQKGWLSIINADADAWENLKEKIQNADGATEEMMNEIQKSGAYGFKVMSSAIEDLLLTIGDALAPALVSVGKDITELATKISNWVQKMHETNPQMLEMIGKLALFAAAAGPVLMILGSMSNGLGTLVGGIGKGIGAFTKFKGKLVETAATAATGTSKFSILASTIGISGPALIALGVAALAGLATAIGTNENALAWLQDKWGAFGTVVGGVCEFIAGSVQLTFGNLLIIIGTAGKAIGALLKGKVWEIDDIIREGNSKIVTNTSKAWSNIKMESTRALTHIRNATQQDMSAVNKVFEESLKTLPKVTKDNVDEVAKGFTDVFKSTSGNMLELSDTTIQILRGTSDTMASLFDGIKGNMNIDEARTRFGYNMMQLLQSGKISAEGLKSEFDKAGKLIADNLGDSMKRAVEDTGKILSELGDIARDGLEPVAQDITSIVDGMSKTTVETVRGMGQNWNTILKGVAKDGSMSTQEMNKQILANLEELGLSSPEKLQKFKEALVKEMEAAKKGAEEASKGTKEKVEENVVPDGAATAGKTKEAMNQNTEAVEQGGKEAEQAAKEGGQKTKQAFGESANATPGQEVNLDQEVAKAGDKAKEVAGQKGGEVINNMTNSMNSQLPQMSGVTSNISNQLSKIDNIKLGGVTKQLAEVNKWLIAVNKAAVPVRSSLNNLCNIPFGNTTRALSQINQWLNKVRSAAVTTRSAMMNLTNLPFGNTTKGLSEVDRWLKTVERASSWTRKGLKGITEITYGRTTKGLSEINKWLNSIRSSASSARSALASLSSVGFGGVTKGLSEVNRWLGIVRSSAGSTRSAVASVSTARPRTTGAQAPSAQPRSFSFAASFSTMVDKLKSAQPTTFAAQLPRFDARDYQMGYNQSTMSNFGPTVQLNPPETTDQGGNEDLIEAIMALVQVIGSQQINAVLNMNGKTLATATAPFIRDEITKIDKRKGRLAGK